MGDSVKITKQMLLDKEACSEQVRLFVSLFGDEAKVTKANVLKAYNAGLDLQWAANNLLTSSQYKSYKAIRQPVLEAYKKHCALDFYLVITKKEVY